MEIQNTLTISTNLIYRNNPSAIVLLDSGSSVMTIETMDKLHKSLGLWMYGYHYFIDKSGDVFSGRPERALSCNADVLMETQKTNMISLNISPFSNGNDVTFESNTPSNVISAGKIFICIEGLTSQSPIPPVQLDSINNLCKDIYSRYRNLNTIYSFNELVPSIKNPGVYMDMNSIRSEVQSTSIPTYTPNPGGTISYSFGKRILYYDPEIPIYGNDVSLLQKYLGLVGYQCESSTGTYDLITYTKVTEFQKFFKLPIDGIFDTDDFYLINELIKALYKKVDESVYHRNLEYSKTIPVSGPDVLRLQKQLNDLELPCVMSSIFDISTMEAVKLFQRNQNLTVDGRVGPITWKLIMSSIIIVFERVLYYTGDNNNLLKGTDVDYVQKKIKDHMRMFGLSNISMSGSYDQLTSNNISIIQSRNMLAINGKVDKDTFDFLKNI